MMTSPWDQMPHNEIPVPQKYKFITNFATNTAEIMYEHLKNINKKKQVALIATCHMIRKSNN